MKQFLIILVLIAIMPMAMAQEDRDVNAFIVQEGVELRFAQLERAVFQNELIAQRVINHIRLHSPDINLTSLEDLHLELQIIRSDISNLNLSEHNRSKIIDLFIEYRQALNDASREFRQEAHNYLDQEKRTNLAQRENLRPQLQEYDFLVRERLNRYNAAVYERRLTQIGVEDVDVQRIRDSELRAQEIREQMLERIRALEINKQEVARQLREQRTREVSQTRSALIQRDVQDQRADLRDTTINRAREIRSNNIERDELSPYRFVLNRNERETVGNYVLTIDTVNQRQASLLINDQRRVELTIGERRNFGDFSLMYYDLRDIGAVFVVYPNLEASVERHIRENTFVTQNQRTEEQTRPVEDRLQTRDTNDRNTDQTRR